MERKRTISLAWLGPVAFAAMLALPLIHRATTAPAQHRPVRMASCRDAAPVAPVEPASCDL